GAENKNIWATKFALIYMIYLYICAFDNFNINLIEKISFIILGIVTVVLLLSRTAQVAIIIPIVFLAFYSMRNLNYKYRIGIYAVSGILFLGALFVFFDKFFHLEFNMTDGGFTRLYIWKEFIISVFDTHFIVGNGIGYSAYFIQDILGRFESNLHNVFLNIFFELGIIGIVLYITFIIQFFKDFITRKNILKNLFMIIFPMLAIVCLQYLGYDNDLVVTLTLLIIINMIMKKDEQRI
ncbi:O-antigen ligase family protein, partial [Clostridium perfringens]|nr:O-antigen ligase family protein [Clostridium perfringens]